MIGAIKTAMPAPADADKSAKMGYDFLAGEKPKSKVERGGGGSFRCQAL